MQDFKFDSGKNIREIRNNQNIQRHNRNHFNIYVEKYGSLHCKVDPKNTIKNQNMVQLTNFFKIFSSIVQHEAVVQQ